MTDTNLTAWEPIEAKLHFAIPRDFPDVMRIQKQHPDFLDVDSKKQLRKTLLNRDCVFRVAKVGKQIVGYRISMTRDKHFRLEEMAVDREFMGLGIGRRLIADLYCHLGVGREFIEITVPEDNLGFQLFLRSVGAVATDVIREVGGDSFRFVLRDPWQPELLELSPQTTKRGGKM